MAEYPNSSHSIRKRSDAAVAGKTEKKLNEVVTGVVKIKRKNGTRRLLSTFTPDDTESAKSSVLSDVVVPDVKATIASMISIIPFGDTGRIDSRKSGGSRIVYQKYYGDRRNDRREYGRPRAVVGFEYNDTIFETRGDVNLVLDQLESVIAEHEAVSVADLYDPADAIYRDYTTNHYGQSGIQLAKVVRTLEGYTIRFPWTAQIS